MGCKNSKLHGEHKVYKDGKLLEIQYWEKGSACGVWEWYYDNGVIHITTRYKYGKRNGLCISIQKWWYKYGMYI